MIHLKSYLKKKYIDFFYLQAHTEKTGEKKNIYIDTIRHLD